MGTRTISNIMVYAYLFIPVLLVSILSGSTFDGGDSIMHFLIAKYSFQHPDLFVDHWGKPFFTLLSSPFAQFGFKGMVLFNAIVIYSSAVFVYEISCTLNQHVPASILSATAYVFCTKVLLFVNSGLTEPLFGLLLIAGLYFSLRDQYVWSAVVISFIPFVRSEGMMIVVVYFAYFLLTRTYAKSVFLLTGLVLYALIGKLFFSFDYLWYFTKNPYPVTSQYGSGDWVHYFNQFYFYTGMPFTVLFCLGLIVFVFKYDYKLFKDSQDTKLFWLAMATTGVYFFSHVVFWKVGCCGAYGIPRVLMSILSLSAVIVAIGINKIFALEVLKNKREILALVLGVVIIAFPFIGTPSSWDFKSDFSLSPGQRYAKSMFETSDKPVGFRKENMTSVSDPYVIMLLGIDVFDSTKAKVLKSVNMDVKDNVVWDAWYSEVEGGISEQNITDAILQKGGTVHKHYRSKEDERPCYITNF